MKKLLLISFSLFSAILTAQNLSKVKSQQDVVINAKDLINNTNSLQFEASKLFTEENKFVVKFTNKTDYTLVTYNHLKSETEDSFVFVSATGSYENMLPIWNRLSHSSKDKYFDKENNVVYYFSESDDDKWIIQSQTLK